MKVNYFLAILIQHPKNDEYGGQVIPRKFFVPSMRMKIERAGREWNDIDSEIFFAGSRKWRIKMRVREKSAFPTR